MILLKLNNVKDGNLKINDFDPELDDERAIFSEVCFQINDLGGALFKIETSEGFNWPVDITTDLPILMEQVPYILKAVKSKEKQFSLDFYEQGIESQIRFQLKNQEYKVTHDGLIVKDKNWLTSMSVSDVSELFTKIQKEFLEFIKERLPSLLNEPCIKEWSECLE